MNKNILGMLIGAAVGFVASALSKNDAESEKDEKTALTKDKKGGDNPNPKDGE